MVQASQEKESNSLLRRVCPPDAGLIPCHVTPAFPTGPALMIIADFCIALSRGMLRLMLEEHRPPASKQKREAEASLSSPIERLTWISPCRPSGTPARTPARGLRPCRLPHGSRAPHARAPGPDNGRHRAAARPDMRLAGQE